VGWRRQRQRKSDNTPLHVASNSDTVAVLIHAGASVNVQNEWGKTPLMTAVIRANIQTVTRLIQCGACCNTSDKEGKTALHYAVSQSNPNMNIIQFLVEHGADLNSRTKSGCTPLFMACWFGNREAAEWLCKAGASVNEANYIGHTPLCVLLKDHPFAEGDEEQTVGFVEMLLSYGCDVNHRTDSGKSLLMLYIEGLFTESNKEDLASNNLSNFKDRPEKMMKIINAIIELLENGTSINDVDMNGDTALHKAAWISDMPVKIAQTILRKGANPNLGNNLKTAALHLAVDKGVDWIRTLVGHGADVNSKDKYGSTALHYAAWEQVSSEITDFLVAACRRANRRC
jgi:ankyrin repeat protein